ncbi:molybdenum cofactor sulfurase [Pseudonocardia sp. CNS-139]|nr:molybdenum cofactor sulfurase [Pseudonocardia sp. CNS-139]
MDGSARVAELRCYPVKGCAGTRLRAGELTPAGLAHDRTFLVVSPEGVFRTQRRHPQLATVHPGIDAAGSVLTLRAAGREPLVVPVDVTGPRMPVELFGAGFTGIDQGEDAAEWISDVLGEKSRLVRVPPEHARVTDGETPGTSGYADSSAVHLTSWESWEALNGRIVERGDEPVAMARFRPNIVVSGLAAAHAEDRLRRVAVGGAELGFTKLAVRCAVTTVDQLTGERVGPEPLRTLAGYRRHPDGGVTFGVKFSVTRPGPVAVGDELRTIETA